MIKQCANCLLEFETNDIRTKNCSKACANRSRSLTLKSVSAADYVHLLPPFDPVSSSSLPPVEELPAAYVKRCHDLWVSLIDASTPTRIA